MYGTPLDLDFKQPLSQCWGCRYTSIAGSILPIYLRVELLTVKHWTYTGADNAVTSYARKLRFITHSKFACIWLPTAPKLKARLSALLSLAAPPPSLQLAGHHICRGPPAMDESNRFIVLSRLSLSCLLCSASVECYDHFFAGRSLMIWSTTDGSASDEVSLRARQELRISDEAGNLYLIST